MTRTALAAAAALTTLSLLPEAARAQRAIGIDVSTFQGTIDWATVAKSKAQGGGGIQFAFIRATRGRPYEGYVGAYEDDDYDYNIANAKANGVLAGAYHYARYDLNDALEEADDFLAVAGNQMRPGYLRPVLDLEQDSSLTPAQVSTWALTFSNRIFEATGVRPIVYANTSYARDSVSGTTSLNGVTLKNHDFWLARYYYTSASSPTQATRDFYAAQAQTNSPPTPSGYANPYGIWDNVGNEWDFWQYTDGGRTAGISGNVDQDVANGDIEFVKDFVVPAVWTDASGGNFGGSGKWNNYASVAGTLYFPDANTRAIISLPAASPTITYNGMNRTMRSLQSDEAMTFVSGTLTALQYANLTNTVSVTGGGITAGSIANTGAMTITGGAVSASGAFTGTGTTAVGGGTLAAASLAQASLTITGGTTTITGALTTTGGTNVSAGTLNVGSMPSGALALTGTGFAKLTGTGGSKVTSLGVANTADLDVGLTELAVDYTSSSPLASYRTALAAGAIASNKAAAGVTGVGAVESKARFGNTMTTASWGDAAAVTVDGTAVLVALALFGDTNLDRVVNLVDLTNFAAHYLNPASLWNWQDGDFTYDGGVTSTDLALLRANYGRTLLADGSYTAANPAQFDVDVAGFSTIPEPASLAALSLLGAALRRRRRSL